MSAAARQRLHLERRRNGLRVCHVLVHEVGIVAMLQAEGLLASDGRARLDEALSKWLYAAMTRHEQEHWPVP